MPLTIPKPLLWSFILSFYQIVQKTFFLITCQKKIVSATLNFAVSLKPEKVFQENENKTKKQC
jgi:hypothetical protein